MTIRRDPGAEKAAVRRAVSLPVQAGGGVGFVRTCSPGQSGCVAADPGLCRGALLTGGIAFLETETFKRYWAVLNTLSVVMAIWAAIMSYSEKEFE